MTPSNPFPLQGIIGVVANGREEIQQARSKNLGCIELRADLLIDSGLSSDDVLTLIGTAKAEQLAVLFTLRHPTHGGKFDGTEQERVQINQQALQAGADVIDLEWQSEASQSFTADNTPLLLSHHDFEKMLSESELTELTNSMAEFSPFAIKIVPTAHTIVDSMRMLNWVQEQTSTRRVGFAMSQMGSSSRILALSKGSPITYATFGEIVAPGQVDIDDLIQVYRAANLNNHTKMTAVLGEHEPVSIEVAALNAEFARQDSNEVAIGFIDCTAEDISCLNDVIEKISIREMRS